MKYSLYALLGFAVVCLFAFMFVAAFLLYFTSPNSSSAHLQYFGQVGDFFGGMLNPILAFASFIALLYTIRIQSEELRLTKNELKRSADAHEKTEKNLREQIEVAKKQAEVGYYHEIFRDIDHKLSQKLVLEFKVNNTVLGFTIGSYYMIIRSLIGMAKSQQDSTAARASYQKIASDNVIVTSLSYDISMLIVRMASLLAQYGERFGQNSIYLNYTLEYNELVGSMHALGIFNAKQDGFRAFDIDEFYTIVGLKITDS